MYSFLYAPGSSFLPWHVRRGKQLTTVSITCYSCSVTAAATYLAWKKSRSTRAYGNICFVGCTKKDIPIQIYKARLKIVVTAEALILGAIVPPLPNIQDASLDPRSKYKRKIHLIAMYILYSIVSRKANCIW